jgi:alcohol dehydrogenase class IV
MFNNPVKYYETSDWNREVFKQVDRLSITKPLIFTSEGNFRRQNLKKIFKGQSIFCVNNSTPTFTSCLESIMYSYEQDYDGVIALGGGSVMDTAKVVMASRGTGVTDIRELIDWKKPYQYPVHSIFIPTTHGTGSEATKWGTIWNRDEKKKYSISHTSLYPNIAILDAYLTLDLPIEISLYTVLDALSHCFEAIWNVNANAKSTSYAVEGIGLILESFEEFICEPRNIKYRKPLLMASHLAGLAFSNTKTAAAHAISYPLTIHFGIPHGLASSLPLPQLLLINKHRINDDVELILERTKLRDYSALLATVKKLLHTVPRYRLRSWGLAEADIERIIPECFGKDRMSNNIVKLSKYDVSSILSNIL